MKSNPIMTEAEIEAAVVAWEAALEVYEAQVIDAAYLAAEIPIIDVSEALRECPKPVLGRLMERRRQRSPEAAERKRRMAWEKRKQAEAAERLATMLDAKGKDEQAASQRARAKAILAEVEQIEKEVLS